LKIMVTVDIGLAQSSAVRAAPSWIPWSGRSPGMARMCRRSPQRTSPRRRSLAVSGAIAIAKATSTTLSSLITKPTLQSQSAARCNRSREPKIAFRCTAQQLSRPPGGEDKNTRSQSACRIRNVVGDKMEAAKLRGNSSMSKRIDKSWLVFISIENFEHNRCIDLFSRPDGSCGFEEFRRDAEDRGEWTPVQYYSGSVYASREAALTAAMQSVAWLPDAIRQSPSAQKLLPGRRG
jgi:hypothetical protein